MRGQAPQTKFGTCLRKERDSYKKINPKKQLKSTSKSEEIKQKRQTNKYKIMPIKINKFYLPLLPFSVIVAAVVIVVVAVTFIVLLPCASPATVALALHFKELLPRRCLIRTILFNLL